MTQWIDIGKEGEYSEEALKCVSAGDREVVICQVDGQLAAVSNICPHAGLPLSDGELRGKVLVCPFHGYAYNVLTGRNTAFPYEEPPLKTFPLRCTDAGRIEVEIPDTIKGSDTDPDTDTDPD